MAREVNIFQGFFYAFLCPVNSQNFSGLVLLRCNKGIHLSKCMCFITVNKTYLRKITCLSPLRFHGAKDRHRVWTSKLPESFTNLECPSSYCQSSQRATIKFFTHLFFSSFFVSWEDTSLEKPLRLLFKGLCVAGWQRTPLSAFSLIWKDRVKLKRGFSAPSPQTLSTPAPSPTLPPHLQHGLGGLPWSVLRPPLSVWYQRYCERLTKNRKPGGRQGRPEGQLNQSLHDGCSMGARSPENAPGKMAKFTLCPVHSAHPTFSPQCVWKCVFSTRLLYKTLQK